MKYIIMADGKGTRWNNYNDIPKHFIKMDGETLLERTVRLLREKDPGCQVIITSVFFTAILIIRKRLRRPLSKRRRKTFCSLEMNGLLWRLKLRTAHFLPVM